MVTLEHEGAAAVAAVAAAVAAPAEVGVQGGAAAAAAVAAAVAAPADPVPVLSRGGAQQVGEQAVPQEDVVRVFR